jgi:hypothetical protein
MSLKNSIALRLEVTISYLSRKKNRIFPQMRSMHEFLTWFASVTFFIYLSLMLLVYHYLHPFGKLCCCLFIYLIYFFNARDIIYWKMLGILLVRFPGVLSVLRKI